MNRPAVHLAALVIALLAGPVLATEATPPDATCASIDQLQQRMDARTPDSRQLTRTLLDRIQRIDRSGPTLRAVIETNPEALELAGALDARRTKSRGPLYGIPVLLKDNVDTGDHMRTTAGSLALLDAPAARDAGLVERLRKAGALIPGKTNLSEWANFRSGHASSGWSGRGDPEFTVLLYDFKHDVNAYLVSRHGLRVKTLADLIAFNQAHAAEEMPWFGQELFEKAEQKGPLGDKAYADVLATAKRLSGLKGIDAALQSQQLDALPAPSWGPAFVTDPVLGDHIVSGDPTVGGASQSAAVAGYPSITVPVGFAHGLSVDIVLFGAKWSESTLIAIAYGFEQHAKAWQAPRFLPTVATPR